jgi:hypothetical protein
MNPEEALIQLKATISPRSHKALDAIYNVCQQQMERGISDFSYATISRLGASNGTPKAQSIRNKTGDCYKALIKSFVDEIPKKTIQKNKAKRDNWIDEINDPKLKLLVSIQASELKEAKRVLKEIIPPGFEITIDDRKKTSEDYRFSDSERSALEYVSSKEFMEGLNLAEGKRGELLDAKGNRIFKVGTMDAIQKALRLL